MTFGAAISLSTKRESRVAELHYDGLAGLLDTLLDSGFAPREGFRQVRGWRAWFAWTPASRLARASASLLGLGARAHGVSRRFQWSLSIGCCNTFF